MVKQSKKVVFAVEPVRQVIVMDTQLCVYMKDAPEGVAFDPKTLLLNNGDTEAAMADWYKDDMPGKIRAALEAAGIHAVMFRIDPDSGAGVILSNGERPNAPPKERKSRKELEAVPMTVTATVTEDEEAGDEYDFSEFTDQELCDYATEHKVTGFSLGKGGKFSAKGRELLAKKIVAALTAEAAKAEAAPAQAEAAPAKSDKKASKKKANKTAA